MDQRIINLYDEYTHQPLSRDTFIKRLVKITGSMAAAMTILPLIESNYAQAAVTQSDELLTERINYDGANGKMSAYVARPKKEGKYATVMVIHENRGLNPHIEDVTRRAARAGYLAIAPDALAPQGGTPESTDQAREMFGKLTAQANLENFIKGFEYIKTRNDSNGSFGCVGFCWGGALANQLAVNMPNLRAAVAFYGRQPEIADVIKIKSVVQLHYGALDERINAGIPAYEQALKNAGIVHEVYIYEGTNHAFHNDTSGARYNEAAAKLAWQRTLDFYKKFL